MAEGSGVRADRGGRVRRRGRGGEEGQQGLTRSRKVEEVADADWNVVLHGWQRGPRMKHIGPKV